MVVKLTVGTPHERDHRCAAPRAYDLLNDVPYPDCWASIGIGFGLSRTRSNSKNHSRGCAPAAVNHNWSIK